MHAAHHCSAAHADRTMIVRVAGEVLSRQGKVVVVVSEMHTAQDAARCAAVVEANIAARKQIDLVVDLTNITGFTRDAREEWQRCLLGTPQAIRTLTIVGGTPLARMASAAVCLYAGIKMRAVRELSEAFSDSPHR